MLFVIPLVCLLLPLLASGGTVQQELLCTNSYAQFESASVGSNVSGSDIRNQLYKVFYAPNKHLPYSVFVTYQLVLANGTRVNLSSDPDCRTELWAWLSSPVFLVFDSTYLNRLLLFTLNYFVDWDSPHVTITTVTAPCTEKTRDFLNEMTASLQDYALGQMENKVNLGYAEQGCGTSTLDTRMSSVEMGRALTIAITVIIFIGAFFQIMFMWIVSAVLLKKTFREYSQKTFAYSYDTYGMFWGISITAVVIFGVMFGVYTATAFKYAANWKNAAGRPIAYLGASLAPLGLELPVAIYIARKATVAVPCVFKYPVTLLCCGRRRQAECFVTATVLWVDLVVLQLILLQGALVVFAISAAPFALASNVMLVVLAVSCLANIFSLLFTIFAHLCTPADQRVHSSSMVLHAVVVLPLLLMIMCYVVVVATMSSVTNVDLKKNTLSFASSIATPILLGVISIFLKQFISAWLKWSPREVKQETNGDEDLLDTLLIEEK